MDYKTRVKLNLMKGRAFNIRGQGFGGMGAVPTMRLSSGFRQPGTISHRAVVGALDPLMQQLSLTTAPKRKSTGATKKASKKGKGAKKSTNYKSLKFNF